MKSSSNVYIETQDLLVALVSALQTLPASRHLPSSRGGKNLLEDLSRLMTAVNTDDFDVNQMLPLLQAILHKESDSIIWDNGHPYPSTRAASRIRASTANT